MIFGSGPSSGSTDVTDSFGDGGFQGEQDDNFFAGGGNVVGESLGERGLPVEKVGSENAEYDRRASSSSSAIDFFDNNFDTSGASVASDDGVGEGGIVNSKRYSLGGTYRGGIIGDKSSGSSLMPVSDEEDEADDDEYDDVFLEGGEGGGGGALQYREDRGWDEIELKHEEYTVLFENEVKLGMLLERHDEVNSGSSTSSSSSSPPGRMREVTIVKMVVEHGAADVKGVEVGSRVVAVNGARCEMKPYLEVLNMVKSQPRPLRLTFVRGTVPLDDCYAGYCLVRKSVGPLPPSAFVTWKRKYFVLGGAVANRNVLQVYDTKRDYEHVVVSLFSRKQIDVKLKAYKLTPEFTVTRVKSVRYEEVGANVFWWGLMTPGAKLKMIKFGSDDDRAVRELHTRVTRFTGISG